MEDNEKSKILQHLTENGCCSRCILRFTGNASTNFELLDKLFQNEITVHSNGDSNPPLKKPKLSPCIICLNLLEEDFLDQLVSSDLLSKVAEYDSETFVNFITFPVSVNLREHRILVELREKYPTFFSEHTVIPINKAWSWSIQKKLAQKINKKFSKNAPLMVHFITNYIDEDKELEHVSRMMKKTKISRNYIEDTLSKVDGDLLKKYFPDPLTIPDHSVTLSDISCSHEAIFIAGRYCKYSRHLGQTPWFINNVRKTENSVQEIIFEGLGDIFKCKEMVFASSGREDFDVRTLGSGRPFYVRIVDAKITKIPFETFRKTEEQIKKTNLISVLHLQHVAKNDVDRIKEGEQYKKKSYRALCIIDKPDSLDSCLSTINSLNNITLEQKTPIRVYHRRSAGDRQKEIHSIQARAISGRNNLFELDVVTQAGTYVKEFVHGDLGRTKPSLRKLIGSNVDIVTLDVTDINLDFPPPIVYEKKENPSNKTNET